MFIQVKAKLVQIISKTILKLFVFSMIFLMAVRFHSKGHICNVQKKLRKFMAF